MIVSISKGAETVIDDCDADLFEYHWFYSPQGYVVRTFYVNHRRKPIILLHKVIMERKLGYPVPRGYIVDHINRDRLDNRRENLRLATKAQNAINSKTPCSNTSGYKGIVWDKTRRKWRAQIMLQQKCLCIGRFESREEAVEARRRKAIELFGEFAEQEGA